MQTCINFSLRIWILSYLLPDSRLYNLPMQRSTLISIISKAPRKTPFCFFETKVCWHSLNLLSICYSKRTGQHWIELPSGLRKAAVPYDSGQMWAVRKARSFHGSRRSDHEKEVQPFGISPLTNQAEIKRKCISLSVHRLYCFPVHQVNWGNRRTIVIPISSILLLETMRAVFT